METVTCRIGNLSEFFSFLEDNILKKKGKEVFFRGQASTSWNLEPSIFRHKDLDEIELLKIADTDAWQYLNSCKNAYEKLILLQHYGLPTRLLDVTFNPLIALYFACNEHPNDDARLFWGFSKGRTKEKAYIKSMELLFESSYWEKESMDKSVFENRDSKKSDAFYEPCLIHAPHNNERIHSQHGAFLAPPMAEECDDNKVKPVKKYTFDIAKFQGGSVVVSGNCKAQILEELDKIGINKGTIFPGFSSLLETIVQRAKQKKLEITGPQNTDRI